eukprot:5489455-Amphidinium_carterae.1
MANGPVGNKKSCCIGPPLKSLRKVQLIAGPKHYKMHERTYAPRCARPVRRFQQHGAMDFNVKHFQPHRPKDIDLF